MEKLKSVIFVLVLILIFIVMMIILLSIVANKNSNIDTSYISLMKYVRETVNGQSEFIELDHNYTECRITEEGIIENNTSEIGNLTKQQMQEVKEYVLMIVKENKSNSYNLNIQVSNHGGLPTYLLGYTVRVDGKNYIINSSDAYENMKNYILSFANK